MIKTNILTNKNKKTQSGLEIIILFIVLFMIFFVVIGLSKTILAGVRYNNEIIDASEICGVLTFALDEVTIGGEGTNTEIYLRNMKSGIIYTLKLYPEQRLAEIKWNNKRYIKYFLNSNLIGNTTLTPGHYNITNLNGTIRIANI